MENNIETYLESSKLNLSVNEKKRSMKNIKLYASISLKPYKLKTMI